MKNHNPSMMSSNTEKTQVAKQES